MKKHIIHKLVYFLFSLYFLLSGFRSPQSYSYLIDRNVSRFISSDLFYFLFCFLMFFSLFVVSVTVYTLVEIAKLDIVKNSRYLYVVHFLSCLIFLDLIFSGVGSLFYSIIAFLKYINSDIALFRITIMFGTIDIACGILFLFIYSYLRSSSVSSSKNTRTKHSNR
jgi:hypothetical protein